MSLKSVLWIQSAYYLATALWPLLHIESFMIISGPKTDIWLVKTVAVLLLAICTCFIAGILTRSCGFPIAMMAIASCIGLATIDIFYSSRGIISTVYLVDAAVEILLLILWGLAIWGRPSRLSSKHRIGKAFFDN